MSYPYPTKIPTSEMPTSESIPYDNTKLSDNMTNQLQNNMTNELEELLEKKMSTITILINEKISKITTKINEEIYKITTKINVYKDNLLKYKLYIILFFGIIFTSSCLTIINTIINILKFINIFKFKKK